MPPLPGQDAEDCARRVNPAPNDCADGRIIEMVRKLPPWGVTEESS